MTLWLQAVVAATREREIKWRRRSMSGRIDFAD